MLYVNYANLNSEGYIGIKKKVLAQCRVFEKEFGKIYYTELRGLIMYLIQNDIIIDKN